MPFEKGHKKIEGSGRVKGSTSKSSEQVRRIMREGLLERSDRFFEELDQLEGQEYTSAWMSAMNKVLPSLKPQEEDNTKKQSSAYDIVIRLANRDKEE